MALKEGQRVTRRVAAHAPALFEIRRLPCQKTPDGGVVGQPPARCAALPVPQIWGSDHGERIALLLAALLLVALLPALAVLLL